MSHHAPKLTRLEQHGKVVRQQNKSKIDPKRGSNQFAKGLPPRIKRSLSRNINPQKLSSFEQRNEFYFGVPLRLEPLKNYKPYSLKQQNGKLIKLSFLCSWLISKQVDADFLNSFPKLYITKNCTSSNQEILDLKTLAFASKRAGKKEEEANFYYKMGVLYDCFGEFEKSIECYELYYNMCLKLKNFDAAAVALNHIGVAYQYQAFLESFPPNDKNERKKLELLNKSIKVHLQQTDLSEKYGQAIAMCNIGLCYSMMKNYQHAIMSYKTAIQYARELQVKELEFVCLENLSFALVEIGSYSIAEETLKNALKLQREFPCPDISITYILYGHLFTAQEQYAKAILYYQCALRAMKTLTIAKKELTDITKIYITNAMKNTSYSSVVTTMTENLGKSINFLLNREERNVK